MELKKAEEWNNLICNTNNKKNYLFEVTKYKKFNKTTFLKYLKNSSFTFNSQYISVNILLFLEKYKIFDGDSFNNIYHFNKDEICVFIKKNKIILKKYQIGWRLLHLYTLKYYKKIKPFELEILKKNFIDSNGFTNNINIEVILNSDFFNLPKTRADLLIKLKNNKMIIIEFNENSHKHRERCSLREEERNLALANGALMKGNNLDSIRFIWESILYKNNKRKIFYNFLDSIKNKIIFNSINKEDFIINKINYYFGESFSMGNIIYDCYKDNSIFKIDTKIFTKEIGLCTKNAHKKLVKLIKKEQIDIVNYLTSEKQKEDKNFKNNDDGIIGESFDSESEDDYENNLNELYYVEGKLNFNGMIAFLKNIIPSNNFDIYDVIVAQKLIKNIFDNFIKAYEDLYDEVSLNSEFIKHFN